ncbi:MAG: serine protease [Gemmatales bacterium]|nr:serine protease [Gemmatales bacterium]
MTRRNALLGRWVAASTTTVIMVLAWLLAYPEFGGAQNAEGVYKKSVHGVVWIVRKAGWFREVQGSGFLADRERKLVVTNHHVIEDSWYVDVYFPSRDAQGRLITDQNFYKNNQAALQKLGFATQGCLVAYDAEKDLAVLRVSSVPKDAVVLRTANANPDQERKLHVIGHPAGRPLWSYCPGIEPRVMQFRTNLEGQELDFQAVEYKSGVFNGNSGGPVLNDRGEVVGVNSCQGGEGGMSTVAVHWQEINALLSTLECYHVVGIENATWSKVFYEIRWGDQGKWERIEIGAKSRYVHWWKGLDAPKPHIRFDSSADPGFQEKTYQLDTYVSYLGKNVQPDFDRDAREYVFRWKDNKNLELQFRR